MASLFGKNKLREIAKSIDTESISDYIDIVKTWHHDYHNGSLKLDKETSREQAYNQDFFIRILGYKEKPAVPYSFEPKATTEKGQLPDAVLSYTDKLSEVENIAAVVELKGAAIELDRPQRRDGNMSPVQQAFKYKTQYRNCPFVIASNFWELRLYQDNQLDYELWTLDDLIDPEDNYLKFKTFYALLHSSNFTSPRGASKTEGWLSDIRFEQEEIGKKFYKIYRDARLELLQDIYQHNASVRLDIDMGIEKAQKIIDRIVFACFAEDRGLLPDDTLRRVIKAADTSAFGGSLWSTFKGFFEAIDSGSEKLEIPNGYNGGLFAADAVLNDLKVSDEPLRKVAKLSDYSFVEDLSVTILGHIFEQSISDLEEIKSKVQENNNLDIIHQSRRKKDGIFYTPDYIVRYIVDNSLGAYLREEEERLKTEFKLKDDINDKNYEKRERQAYSKYQDFLQNVKVVDPACGSGAFLVYVFDYLLAENKRIESILGHSLFSSDDYIKSILQNNIYGVDLNDESVEITKLSLWLKSAQKGKKLTTLDGNIKCGNSLIGDSNVVGDKAFDWQSEFPEIFTKGGFDVVVMNPPYVDSESMTSSIPEQREYLAKSYTTTKGNWDLYIPFIEHAVNILKDGGYASLITPDKWISKPFGYAIRQKLVPMFIEIVVAGREVFHDAKVDSIITTLSKRHTTELSVRQIEIDHTFQSVNKVKKDTIKDPYTIDHLFSKDLPLITKIETQKNQLIDIAECENACSTSDTYKLKDLISEARNTPDDYLRMINTGTIDKYISRWGVSPMTYLGDKYLYPVVERQRFETDFGNSYYRKSVLPKIIIKGLTLLDASADFEAKVVPGKSTLVIPNEDERILRFLLVFVNSRLPLFYIKRKYSSASYNGGINFTKDMINKIPMPELTPDTIEVFVNYSHILIDTSKELVKKTANFEDLAKTITPIDKWPTKLNKWWTLDFTDFVKALKSNLSIKEKSELLELFDSSRPESIALATNLLKTENEVNQLLYKLYELTPEEISIIETN